MQSSKKYKLSSDIVLQELSSEKKAYWCFNTTNGGCFEINSIAYHFLKSLSKPTSFQQAYGILAARCVEMPEQAYGELEAFLHSCVDLNVVSVC